MESWPYYYANATVDSDWDVLQAVISAKKSYPPSLQLKYVRGHQDKQTQVYNLPLPAQLNVEADKFAGMYEYPVRLDPTRVSIITGNAIQLHTKEGTITRNYRQTIRKIGTKPAMEQYLCANNHWSASEFEWIDWDSHGISIQKWYHKKHFITKYLHDWLPLFGQLAKYKSHHSAKCPSCDHTVEDRDHFLRCPGRNWQGDFFPALRQYLDRHKTRPILDDLLNECLRAWLRGQENRLSGYPQLYHRLIRNQFVIGWKQLFFGRFVKEWAELQDDHLAARKKMET
jgi:hypothetical protein